MPKLLWKSLWKWTIDMVVIVAIIGLMMEAFSLLVGEPNDIYFNFFSLMCVPYINLGYSKSISGLSEHFYLAPYSSAQRKFLFKKYFRWQVLFGCMLVAVWYILAYCLVARTGVTVHPVKWVFGLVIQFSMIYHDLFLNYYRPHYLLSIGAALSVVVGGSMAVFILKEPVISLFDGIIMAVASVICTVPSIVLRLKYFVQMADFHSRYEESRRVSRGFW